MAQLQAAGELGFEYQYLPIGDLQVKTEEDPKTGKQDVTALVINDEELEPTQRFWTSLFSRYGFNKAFFSYFSHAEVFQRIAEKEANDRMRLCIERDLHTKSGKLLGVSNPSKPIVVADELMNLLTEYKGANVAYHEGIVESTHEPTRMINLEICGDHHSTRFVMSTPIDGYGSPNFYLALNRHLCNNSVVAQTKTFKAGLQLGKGEDDITPTLVRALDGFNNEEGFEALRLRMASAGQSWASVYETHQLYLLLVGLMAGKQIADHRVAPPSSAYMDKLMRTDLDGNEDLSQGGVGSSILKCFHRMTGDTSKIYGLANLDALSAKRQKTLPTKATVYELFLFGTEIATHWATPYAARKIHTHLGLLMDEEYDMEGTKEKHADFASFQLDAKLRANLAGSSNSISE
jgi:hypothetical protein